MEWLIGIGSGFLILIFSAIIMGIAGAILKFALKFITAAAYLIACLVMGFLASKNGFSIKEILFSSALLSVFAFPILLTAAGYFVAMEYDETKAKIDTLEKQVSNLTTKLETMSTVS